jgi:hypothetical protein
MGMDLNNVRRPRGDWARLLRRTVAWDVFKTAGGLVASQPSAPPALVGRCQQASWMGTRPWKVKWRARPAPDGEEGLSRAVKLLLESVAALRRQLRQA